MNHGHVTLKMPQSRRSPRRLRIYVDRRDWWIGMYIARDAIYVCLAPCVVIRYWRTQHRGS